MTSQTLSNLELYSKCARPKKAQAIPIPAKQNLFGLVIGVFIFHITHKHPLRLIPPLEMLTRNGSQALRQFREARRNYSDIFLCHIADTSVRHTTHPLLATSKEKQVQNHSQHMIEALVPARF